MSRLFPRTQIEGVSLSCMIISTNWILGFSHTGAATDAAIKLVNCNKEISLAALENRPPDITGHASPKKTEIMK